MGADLEIVDLTPAFGSEVRGFVAAMSLDDETARTLRELFDERGVLLFRDLEINYPQQVHLSKLLIRADDDPEGAGTTGDNFYISNKRPKSAAPYGRLQFHSDTMWSAHGFEVLSLYGLEVEQPAVPTTYISATQAWATLSDDLRARVEGLTALHTAGEVRRGDVRDVLLSTVERPRSTTMPIGRPHPRTGQIILYACEQMTKEIVGLPADESEALLLELFAHLYDPATQWHQHWREGDLVVWDNLAIQHGRPNVATDGPARTLRKVASPIPQLDRDELPSYQAAG